MKLTLEEYVKIFNFLSKVIFYSTLGTPYSKNTNPLGPLRKECCTDLIKYDRYLANIDKEINTDKFFVSDIKFQDMYTSKISDKITMSIVTIKNSSVFGGYSMYVNRCRQIFEDDPFHIYVLIDDRLFDGNETKEISCQKYLNNVLRHIIYITVGYDVSKDTIVLHELNDLLSHLLYTDDNGGESYMHKINITIDKITGVVTDDSKDYLSFNLDRLEDIRDIFHDYTYLIDG